MLLKVFAVYDSKALVYGQPMLLNSVGAAVRSFTDAVNDPQSMLCRYPTDFVLYEIGSYDDSTGKMLAIEPFVNLGNGSEFKAAVKPVIYNPAASGEITETK